MADFDAEGLEALLPEGDASSAEIEVSPSSWFSKTSGKHGVVAFVDDGRVRT